ncbi:hypothetical protein ACHAWF_006092, partial [Thalassiosira exigua]
MEKEEGEEEETNAEEGDNEKGGEEGKEEEEGEKPNLKETKSEEVIDAKGARAGKDSKDNAALLAFRAASPVAMAGKIRSKLKQSASKDSVNAPKIEPVAKGDGRECIDASVQKAAESEENPTKEESAKSSPIKNEKKKMMLPPRIPRRKPA